MLIWSEMCVENLKCIVCLQHRLLAVRKIIQGVSLATCCLSLLVFCALLFFSCLDQAFGLEAVGELLHNQLKTHE